MCRGWASGDGAGISSARTLAARYDGVEMQAALLEMTGQRTVPNIFVKGKHVGGNDKLHSLAESGEVRLLRRWRHSCKKPCPCRQPLSTPAIASS